jgi:hypothetical protein
VNTNTLAKHYRHLSVRERLALIQAAQVRGDDVEHQRLRDAAPLRPWQMPDYLMPYIALNTLSLMYIAEQLDHLAVYWHALWRLDDDQDQKPLDWKVCAEGSAYVFTRNTEAWKRFCAGLNIDAAALTAGNYLGWMLQHAERHMPKVSPSRADLCATLRAWGVDQPNPVTVEDLLTSWQRFFDACTP